MVRVALASLLFLLVGCDDAGPGLPRSLETEDQDFRQGQLFQKQGENRKALECYLKVIDARRGSAESHPAHGRWRAARGDGSCERYLGGVHELAEMHVREIERLADLVVAVAAFVFGQQLLDAQAAQMQQVTQRVLEFLRGETAKQCPPRLRDASGIGLVQPVIE